MVPCGSSPVTRFALASAMRKTKRLRRRLSITALFMWVDINTQKRNKLYMLSKIWKQRQTTHKFSRKIFRNPGNCWISEMQTIQSEMMEIPGPIKERKLPRKKKFENWCIPREVVLFYGNFGKNCSIRYWKLPKIQTRCLDWMEGTQLISGQITYLNCECTARMETDCNFIQNGPRFSRISSCVVKKCPRTDDALFPFDRITWCLSCRVPKRRLKSLLRACSIDLVPEKE